MLTSPRQVLRCAVPPEQPQALLKAVAHQPVAVAIQANQRDFQLYAGGVFTAPCGTMLDHGVLVAGYGTNANGTDFWCAALAFFLRFLVHIHPPPPLSF
jgi:Papain family cysteine protease